MKPLKIFLITGFILLCVATAATGYVWLKLQDVLSAQSAESSQLEALDFIELDMTDGSL